MFTFAITLFVFAVGIIIGGLIRDSVWIRTGFRSDNNRIITGDRLFKVIYEGKLPENLTPRRRHELLSEGIDA